MNKNKGDVETHLERNIDIITILKNDFPKLFCVGFIGETNNINEYGDKKLKEKQLDIIAINDLSDGKVFTQEYKELQIISKDGEYSFIERSSKDQVTEELLQIVDPLQKS